MNSEEERNLRSKAMDMGLRDLYAEEGGLNQHALFDYLNSMKESVEAVQRENEHLQSEINRLENNLNEVERTANRADNRSYH